VLFGSLIGRANPFKPGTRESLIISAMLLLCGAAAALFGNATAPAMSAPQAG